MVLDITQILHFIVVIFIVKSIFVNMIVLVTYSISQNQGTPTCLVAPFFS